MSLSDELSRFSTVFIDTAPFIYYLKANPVFGALAKEAVEGFQSQRFRAFTSVVVLLEVLPKPIEAGNQELADKFAMLLTQSKNLQLQQITADIAVEAGHLKGRYKALKSMDAIQLAAALKLGAEAFLTNDTKLTKVTDLRVVMLKDYV